MVRIEKNKVVIEIEGAHPEELWTDILKGMAGCFQALQEIDEENLNPTLKRDMFFVLELFSAMLPEKDQIKKQRSRPEKKQ